MNNKLTSCHVIIPEWSYAATVLVIEILFICLTVKCVNDDETKNLTNANILTLSQVISSSFVTLTMFGGGCRLHYKNVAENGTSFTCCCINWTTVTLNFYVPFILQLSRVDHNKFKGRHI